MELLAIPYLLLLVLGAKATWRLVMDIFPSFVVDELFFAAIVFVLMFLVIGPIMGIITLVKYTYMQVKSGS